MPREPDDEDKSLYPREPKMATPFIQYCYQHAWFCPSHSLDHSTNTECIAKNKCPSRKYQYEEFDPENPDAKMFTHWSMNKEHTGKLCVPWDRYDDFVSELIKGLRKGQRIYMTEKRTKIVRAFMEFDFAALHVRHLPDSLIDRLVQVAIHTFVRFYIPYKHLQNLARTDNCYKTEKKSNKTEMDIECSQAGNPNAKHHEKLGKDDTLHPGDDQCPYQDLFPLRVIVCDTVTKYDRRFNNETYEITYLRDQKVMKGIRVYFPTLYCTSEQLCTMRRAVIYEWIKQFGKTIPGLDDWDKMFDICSYTSNGLRCIGCRKVAPCFACIKQRELLKLANEIKHHSKHASNSQNNVATVSNNHATVVDSSNNANVIDSSTTNDNSHTGHTADNRQFYCRLCNSGNYGEKPKDLDVGRVYQAYQVFSITLRAANDINTSANNDKNAHANSVLHDIAISKASSSLFEHDPICMTLDSKALDVYQLDIGQLVRDTLIRTKFTKAHPIVQLWSLERYEHGHTEKNFSLDKRIPDDRKHVPVTLANGEIVRVCKNAVTVHKSKASAFKNRYPHDHEFCLQTAAFINCSLVKEYKYLDVYEMTSNEENKYYRVNVRGPGATYCQNMAANLGYHRSMSIYFVITPSGISQRCYCKCPGGNQRVTGLSCSKFKSTVVPLTESLKCLLFPDSFKGFSNDMDLFKGATQFAKLKHQHRMVMMMEDRKQKQKIDQLANLDRGIFVEKSPTIISNSVASNSDQSIVDWYEAGRFDSRMKLFSTVGYDIVDDTASNCNQSTSLAQPTQNTQISQASHEMQTSQNTPRVFIPQKFYKSRPNQPDAKSTSASVLPPDFDLDHIVQFKHILDSIVLSAEKRLTGINTLPLTNTKIEDGRKSASKKTKSRRPTKRQKLDDDDKDDLQVN